MQVSKRPFAVFDIDGTLIRWQLYHAVADTMAKQGIVATDKYAGVLEARNDWKRRNSKDAFAHYEASLVNLIDQAIIGVDHTVFVSLCEDVISRYKDQVYTYTRDLIAGIRRSSFLRPLPSVVPGHN